MNGITVTTDEAIGGGRLLSIRQQISARLMDIVDVPFDDVPAFLAEVKRVTGYPEEPSPAIWYLGSPYSHPDREVMGLRYRQACQAAARLFERSIFTYGPIAHTVAIDSEGGLEASDFEPWRIFDLGMIDRCTGLMVLMLEGWEQSKGLTAEIEHARATGKPILWIEPRFDGDRVTGYHMHEQQPEAALRYGAAS